MIDKFISTIDENNFQFETPTPNEEPIPFDVFNPSCIVLPKTKPKKFDYDIPHIAVEVTKDNLSDIQKAIKEYNEELPIYLRTYVPIPIETIHDISYSPFSCIIYNGNTVPFKDIREELGVITACAISAQIRMFCNTQKELADILMLIQETAAINRFPWVIQLAPALKEYKPYILKSAYYFRCGIDVV